MPVIEISPIAVLTPAFVMGAYIGFRRGWQREALTSIGLALAVIVLRRGLDDILWLINSIFEQLTRLGLAASEKGRPPRLTVGDDWEPLLAALLFIVLVALAYVVGSRLGQRYPIDRGGRWFGSLIGGLNLFLVGSRVLGTLRQAQPGPADASGVTIRVPSFPGADIVVPPPTESALLVNWPLATIIFVLVSTLVYLLVRMARA